MYTLAYVSICILVGIMGRRTTIGFWGFFILSLVLTPVIGLLVVIVGSPRSLPSRHYEQRMVRVEVKRD
jgi:hypothetical protein